MMSVLLVRSARLSPAGDISRSQNSQIGPTLQPVKIGPASQKSVKMVKNRFLWQPWISVLFYVRLAFRSARVWKNYMPLQPLFRQTEVYISPF